MVEKSDEFDEHNFAFRKFWYYIFYSFNLLTWVCQDLSHCVETWNLKVYFCSITHKKGAPEDKDPPEGKELPNQSVPYVSKVIPPSSSWSIASCSADVTRVLKQAKRSFTKNCYTKLTPAKKYETYKFSTLTSTL